MMPHVRPDDVTGPVGDHCPSRRPGSRYERTRWDSGLSADRPRLLHGRRAQQPGPDGGRYRDVHTARFGESVVIPDPVGIELDTETLKTYVR
jgi:hypothetical protein